MVWKPAGAEIWALRVLGGHRMIGPSALLRARWLPGGLSGSVTHIIPVASTLAAVVVAALAVHRV